MLPSSSLSSRRPRASGWVCTRFGYLRMQLSKMRAPSLPSPRMVLSFIAVLALVSISFMLGTMMPGATNNVGIASFVNTQSLAVSKMNTTTSSGINNADVLHPSAALITPVESLAPPLEDNEVVEEAESEREEQLLRSMTSVAVKQVIEAAATAPEQSPAALSEIVHASSRRDRVRSAIKHAWDGYKAEAFGHDEVKPVSGGYADNWGGLAWSMVDSLGTLHIAGLRDRFDEARDFVSKMEFNPDSSVSVFEANIRVLGGLLSAHDLSGDSMFLEKAIQMGNALLPAFSTSSGLPSAKVNLRTGQRSGSWFGPNTAVLAEVGTVQMEFGYLSQLSGNPKYSQKALKVWEVLRSASKKIPGLYPSKVDMSSGRLSGDITLGALSDSFYEYLLKVYILSGGVRTEALEMYIESIDAILENMVIEFKDEDGNDRMTLKDLRTWGSEDRLEHLACFTPGMLALGAWYGEKNNVKPLLERKTRHLAVAKQLMNTCVNMYSQMPSGVAPEYVEGVAKHKGKPATGRDRRYLLRPETVESLFVLYRVTGDNLYREQGWRIFSAIETHCRTPIAYSSLVDVSVPRPRQGDNMESFFIAETLKYLYLLFSPPSFIPLDEFVFTTEAHPLRIIAPRNHLATHY